jgi:HlyD family secretion protein
MGLMPKDSLTAFKPTSPPDKKILEDKRGPDRVASRKNRSLFVAALIVIAVFVAGALSWFIFLSPVTVSVAPVQSNVREQVYGLGTVGARVQSNVGFKVGGVLAVLKADQGDRVQAGQVLAQLDARDIEAQVAVAKAAVAQARANIEKAKTDVASASANLENAKAIAARRAALVKKGYATQEETQTTDAAARVAAANFASAQSDVTVSEAALQSAEAQEAFQEATLANYTLDAPYDAWVVSRNLELGSAANPSQSVFTLVAAHTVWVRAYVDERLAGKLSVGQPAEIILRSNPAKPISGQIERIEIQSDPVNEERLVDVAFDKIPDNIHLAEQAEVEITTGLLPHAVLVQPSAVTDLHGDQGVGGRGTVWTVENGHIARRQVSFGPALLDGRLPIIEGLPADAAVVAALAPGLWVGRAAQIAETSRP